MPLSADKVRIWFTQRLHDYYYQYYLASRGYTEAGDAFVESPDQQQARFSHDVELSPSATLADRDSLPGEVAEAVAFYFDHFQAADIGSVRVYVVPVEGLRVFAVRVRTEGDDGYLEIFDEQGAFLATGRTHLDLIAWGSREWLREQVARHGQYPPELNDATARSVWGTPLPWDCQAECWQCRATGQTGFCTSKAGHRPAIGEWHSCNRGGHTWDDTPPDPRVFARPTFTLRLRDDRVVTGTLPDYRMTFETRLGPITVYAADLKKIEFAHTNPHDASVHIAQAIHQLVGPDADVAEAALLGVGPRAFAALVALAYCGDDAIHRRSRVIAGRIKAKTPPEMLNLRTQHLVIVKDASFAGQFPSDLSTFTLMTPGHQSFSWSDVHALTQVPGPSIEVPRPDPRWLGRYYTNWYGSKLSFTIIGNPDGDVFGSGPYSLDSMLAAAAVHAGRVRPGETKVVRVEIILSPPSLVGSARNGVCSLDWDGPATGAFRFVD